MRGRLLIIDDDRSMCALLEVGLTKLGFEVTARTTRQEDPLQEARATRIRPGGRLSGGMVRGSLLHLAMESEAGGAKCHGPRPRKPP
jgi:DNA-binding response OmpR family regulator